MKGFFLKGFALNLLKNALVFLCVGLYIQKCFWCVGFCIQKLDFLVCWFLYSEIGPFGVFCGKFSLLFFLARLPLHTRKL